jgi:cytochrome o ubiquinol oxidase subunit IV
MKHETTKSFIIGFALSILLTLVAYLAVVNHLFPSVILITFILVLAFMQLAVQLLFFLHMGREPRPRWNLYVFLSAFSIILFIVVTSIWIMNHLYHNLMTPSQIDSYTVEQEGMQQ